MDDAFKNLIRGLGGAAVEAGVKALDNRAAKAKAAKDAAPTPSRKGPLTPRQIFGFGPHVKLTEAMINMRYRELARIFHPDLDAGRSDTAMFDVCTKIRDLLRKEIK